MKHLRAIRLAAVLLSALLFSACQQSSAAQPSNFCSRLGAICLALDGTPYIWGGKSASGFDCSGAIYYVARQLGQPVPRTTSKKYFVTTPGESVHWQTAKCGYLTWWQFSQSRPYGHVGIMDGHVGIMVGAGLKPAPTMDKPAPTMDKPASTIGKPAPTFWQAGSSTGFVQRRFETGNFWDKKFQGSKRFFQSTINNHKSKRGSKDED